MVAYGIDYCFKSKYFVEQSSPLITNLIVMPNLSVALIYTVRPENIFYTSAKPVTQSSVGNRFCCCKKPSLKNLSGHLSLRMCFKHKCGMPPPLAILKYFSFLYKRLFFHFPFFIGYQTADHLVLCTEKLQICIMVAS